ncbi:MAG: WxL domain-containing protein [Lactobacillales bacterium]|jgi:hypothetical protein|nr:WxL domain-containing protein [Lactobacillales bacterium]
MDFRNLKLPLVTVVTLSLLAPTGAFAATTETDGKVTFELDSSDLRIVQPGTNAHLVDTNTTYPNFNILNNGAAGGAYAYDNSGFVQLLFAPDFDFGTVKANYKDSATYDVLKIPAQVDSADWETGGYLNPFAQVADFTNGETDWKLDLTLASQFATSPSDVLTGAYLKFGAGNVLNDVPLWSWPGTDTKLVGGQATDTLNALGTINILDHSSTNSTMINGAKWSYVFGSVAAPQDLVDKVDGAAANTYVDKIITGSRDRTAGVQLVVPAAAKPKVGRLYTADLLWTLSSTPKDGYTTSAYTTTISQSQLHNWSETEPYGLIGYGVYLALPYTDQVITEIGANGVTYLEGYIDGKNKDLRGTPSMAGAPGAPQDYSTLMVYGYTPSDITLGTHEVTLHTETGYHKLTYTIIE